jgi:glycosyltransferase involved in cell wall biosynthesis
MVKQKQKIRRILSFYPIHGTFINSIAELFPEIEFDLATIPGITRYAWQKIWETDLVPLEKNIHVVGGPETIDASHYDLRITWPDIEKLAKPTHPNIPSVCVILNRGETAPESVDVVVQNTKVNSSDRQIYLTTGGSRLPKWTGEDNRCYFTDKADWNARWGNESIIGSWAHTLQDTLNEVMGRVNFYFPPEPIPQKIYAMKRARLKAYIEISLRAISSTWMESMFMGQPTIVPDWPEFNTIIKHNENGLLYKNLDECAHYAWLLIYDENLAQKIGSAGRETVERIAGNDVRRKQWAEAFNSALNKKGKQ